MERPQFSFQGQPMDVEGFTSLHIATVCGHAASVEALLALGVPDPNAIGYQATDSLELFGVTALHLAVIHGHLAITHLLMGEVDPDLSCTMVEDQACEIPGLTPLHLAAHHGRPSIARLLLEHERYAAVNVNTAPGTKPPLYMAAVQGHRAVVESLLENERRYELRSSQEAANVFAASVKAGHRSVVAFLMDDLSNHLDVAGMNAGFDEGFGKHSLACAVHEGHRGVVSTLLDYPHLMPFAEDTRWDGVKAAAPAEVVHNASPLHLATLCGHAGVLQALLDSKRFPVAGQCITCCQMPLGKIDLELNIFQLSCLFGQTATVQLLLRSPRFPDEHINTKTVHGFTALHLAVQHAHVNVVRSLLLSHRFTQANAVETTFRGTALHLAVFCGGHFMIVQALLASSRFTARQAKDFRNQTALDNALAFNREDAAELLMNVP